MAYVVGIDIGGSKIEFGLIKGNRVLKKIRIKTRKDKRGIINDLKKYIELILTGINRREVKGIGIGVPGTLDFSRERVLYTPNTALSNVNLKEIIQGRFKLKVRLDNDTNCFALAEKKYGEGRKYRDFIVLTLGTGIGGGVIINDKVYYGRGNAGELGHIKILVKDKIYDLEGLASGISILKRSRRLLGKGVYAGELDKLARKSKKARKILEEIGYYLGLGLSSIANAFDPEIIIIGGGVRSKAMLRKAREVLKREAYNKVKVVFSRLEDAALLGAAALVE